MVPTALHQKVAARTRASLAVLVMSMAAAPGVLAAQSHRDSVMVQAGALRFVRENVAGQGTIAIDTTAKYAGMPAADPRTLREAAVVAALSTRMGKSGDFLLDCEHPRERGECRLRDVGAVAGLSVAYFRADSAYVRMSLMTEAVRHMSGRVYVLHFVKRNDSWEYAGARLAAQT